MTSQAPTNAISLKRQRTPAWKVTPWRDYWEWLSVGQGLAEALRLLHQGEFIKEQNLVDFNRLEHALEQCQVWKARRYELPHAVESSYNLANVLSRDYRSGSDSSADSTLQLAYSTSIIRGVNGLADRLQQSRAAAIPVSVICAQLGLPGWVVDIRHEAAHNALPTLVQLRLAAHTLLGFFQERYWKALAQNREELETRAFELLKLYEDASISLQGDLYGDLNGFSPEDEVIVTQTPSDEKEQGAQSDNQDNRVESDEHDAWLQTNYFAALQEPAKKKAKSSTNHQPEETKEDENTDHKMTASQILSCFVQEIPQDMAYQAVLEYLLWRGKGPHDDSTAVGMLLADGSFSDERFRQLFSALMLAWPGFQVAFLSHCTEFMLQYMDSNVGMKLAHWAEVALSTTPLSESNKTPLPVIALCRRILHVSGAEMLAKVFKKRLGDNEHESMRTLDNWSRVGDWESSPIGSLPGHTT